MPCGHFTVRIRNSWNSRNSKARTSPHWQPRVSGAGHCRTAGKTPHSRFCVHGRCPAEPLGVTLYSVPTGAEDTRLPFRAGTVGLTLGFLVMLCSLSCYSLTGRSQLLRSPMGFPWQTLAKGRHTLLVYSVVFHAATLLQARSQTW